jgi:hypothetical protein
MLCHINSPYHQSSRKTSSRKDDNYQSYGRKPGALLEFAFINYDDNLAKKMLVPVYVVPMRKQPGCG